MKTKNKALAGGSPAGSGPHDKTRQTDDSAKPPQVVEEDAIRKSEKGNMNGKKGYNETPSSVPVQSTK